MPSKYNAIVYASEARNRAGIGFALACAAYAATRYRYTNDDSRAAWPAHDAIEAFERANVDAIRTYREAYGNAPAIASTLV